MSDCGGAAPADQTITLTNTGGQPLVWSAVVRFTPNFSIVGSDGDGGTLAAGQSALIEVAATAVPFSATSGQTYSDQLMVTTNDTTHGPVLIPLTIKAQGASFTVNPKVANFGDVPSDADALTPAIPLTITNTGNKPASVNFSTSTSNDPTFMITARLP